MQSLMNVFRVTGRGVSSARDVMDGRGRTANIHLVIEQPRVDVTSDFIFASHYSPKRQPS